MNIIVERDPADKICPEDIVDPLLVTDGAGRERGRAEINENCSDRKIISANGPKNTLIFPGKLVEVIIKGKSVRGNLMMFSRTYNREGKNFTINSSYEIEVEA